MPTAFLKHCKHTCNQTAPTWLFNRSNKFDLPQFFLQMAISLHQYCNLSASPVHGMINTHPMLCNAQKFLCPSTFVPFSCLCLWLCPLAISPCLSKAMVSTCAHWVLKAGKIKSLGCHCPVMCFLWKLVPASSQGYSTCCLCFQPKKLMKNFTQSIDQ